MIVANATGGLMILFLMVTNGFSITSGAIPSWLKWIYWINPLAWTLRALVCNELDSPRWDVPSGTDGLTMGQLVAETFDFKLGAQWIWGAVGLCWGSLVLYSIAGSLALRWTDPPAPQPTVSEEEQKEEVQRSAFSSLQHVSLAHRSPSQTGAARLSPLPSKAADKAAAAAVAVPFTPITLVCRNIRYYVPDPSKGAAPGVVKDSSDSEIEGKLELLKGIDLYAEPGSLTALMGGSGAGKTTLMDVILGRKTVGLIRGDILVNGHSKQQNTWSRVCGYVEQQDIHSPGSTVREALVFSARLRLDESIGWDRVTAIVDNALETVDLVGLAGNIVGDPGGAGLSVEQRKRLSIAVELVANPSVVMMDEPTSGLDARAAAIVMRAVKNVSLSNRTVMVTIHQPSMDIFEQFTELVLLQRGGRLTYFGPLGDESSALIAYLEAQPGVAPIKPGYNPATWMLEVTGGSMSTTFKSSGLDFPTLYQESELRQRNEARMDELAAKGAKEHEPLSMTSRYATSYSTQRTMLLHKFFIQYWRNPNYNAVRFFMTTCIGLILGLVYLNQGDLTSGEEASVSTVQNIMGLTFTLTIFQGMFNCMTVQPVMAAERTVFYRERASSYYSAVPYTMATGVVELPYLLVQAILMVLVTTYWMVGYQIVFWKVACYFIIYFFSLTMFTYFGQLLTFATPNQLLAQLLSGFLNQIWSLFAGFMVPYPVMPAGWKWLNRISPTTWILYGLAGSQLCDRTDVTMTGFNGQPTTVSAFMESAFGYEQRMVWWCALIVFAFCLVFRVLAMVVLTKVNFQKR
jgi:ABC-type multidrug transport system ATPase subunit/ABC-type multidrug transport system permease subunit